MRVKVLHNAAQPLRPGAKPKYCKRDSVIDIELAEGQALPSCFAPIGVAPEPEAPQVPQRQTLRHLDRDGQILDALNLMDHGDESQWTSQGLPMVEAVSKILEDLDLPAEVTRAEIAAAMPGFVREQ